MASVQSEGKVDMGFRCRASRAATSVQSTRLATSSVIPLNSLQQHCHDNHGFPRPKNTGGWRKWLHWYAIHRYES